MSIKSDLKEYMLTEILSYHDKKFIEPDEDLLKQGVIDSMGVLQLVKFMEKQFGIKVNNEDIIPDNFRNLNCLTEFVTRKGQQQTA